MLTWQTLTVLCLLLWGASGVSQKLATNLTASNACFRWFVYAMLAQSLAMLLIGMIDLRVSPREVSLCILGGTLNGVGTFALFVSMSKGGKASVVTAMAALYPVVTVLLGVMLLGERLTVRQFAGIGLAVLAAVLLSMERQLPTTGQATT